MALSKPVEDVVKNIAKDENEDDTKAKAKAAAVARLYEFDEKHMAPMQRERRHLKKAVHPSHGRRWTRADNATLITLYRRSTPQPKKGAEMTAIATAADRSVKAAMYQLQKMLMTYLFDDDAVMARVRFIGCCLGHTEADLMILLMLSFGGMKLENLVPLKELSAMKMT